MHTEAEQEGRGQQDQRDVAIPAEVAAHFILVKAQVFADFQVLFDVPPGANGPHHDGQRCVGRSPDQVVSQLVRVIEATTKDEPMATVGLTSVDERQAGPVKGGPAFWAPAANGPMPLLFWQRPGRDTGPLSQQKAGAGLPTNYPRQ